MTPLTIGLLFLAGLAAGLIDAIAGGGGLISLPTLLATGLPPHLAMGTNKFQATFGTLVAVRRYAREGLIKWRDVRLAVLVTFVFASTGTLVVLSVNNAVLKKIVPFMLLAVAIYVLLNPNVGDKPARQRLSPTAFALLAGSVLGFYDGFFGPGTGTFWTLACVSLLGLPLTHATAFTKVVNLTSNVAAMIIFMALLHVRYELAAAMIAGQLVGGRLGAGLAIRHGNRLIRTCFIIVVLGIVTKLVWEQWFR